MGNAKDRVGGIDGVHYAPRFTLVFIIVDESNSHLVLWLM